MIAVTLPFPPSVNNLYATSKTRRYVSRRYRRWRHDAGWAIELAKLTPTTGPVHLAILLTVPDQVRRDADNYAKAVIDLAVTHRLIPDDSREVVRSIAISWAEHLGPPSARLTIRPA